MTIDITSLSAKELTSLIAQAEKQQAKLAKRPKASAMRAKIDKYVKDHGYSISELYNVGGAGVGTGPAKKGKRGTVGKTTKGRKFGKVPPKYRNPANSNETWTGRGRQPRWMAAWVAKGKSPNEFLIK